MSIPLIPEILSSLELKPNLVILLDLFPVFSANDLLPRLAVADEQMIELARLSAIDLAPRIVDAREV